MIDAKAGNVVGTFDLDGVAGGSDGAVFHPKTMEAFSTRGKGASSAHHRRAANARHRAL